MVLLAPGRFSTTMVWPCFRLIWSPNRRARVSAPPPAVDGTMILIVRVCAGAGPAVSASCVHASSISDRRIANRTLSLPALGAPNQIIEVHRELVRPADVVLELLDVCVRERRRDVAGG